MLIPCLAGLLCSTLGYAQDPKPIIDNERVVVWDLAGMPGKLPNPAYDKVEIFIARNQGVASFLPKASSSAIASSFHPERTVLIGLKDHKVAPLPNSSGLPNAFPRPGVKKLIDNARVTVWEYTWLPNQPTPMHFHDKDVVVVYLDDGALQSTTPDGKQVVNRYSFDQVKFNPRDRTHTELLVEGHQHAIMMELK